MQGLEITTPDGKKTRLPYHCNGIQCYYICIFGMMLMQYTYNESCNGLVGVLSSGDLCQQLWSLEHVRKDFGRYLVTAMLIGNISSVFWYFYGLYLESYIRSPPTGYVIYDFFMGTVLYPRIGITKQITSWFKIMQVDIKMVAECRWSWLTLFTLTCSAAVCQYKSLGRISPEMAFMVLAHWLYSNATVKGEHYIPCTWV
jgi:delta24(24(1))-sterol reductase